MRISDWSSDVCSSDLSRTPRSIRTSWNGLTSRSGATTGWRIESAAPSASQIGRSSSEMQSPRSRSEEHTSELQSLMRISYAVFCLKKKTQFTRLLTQIYMKINTTIYEYSQQIH